MKPIYKIYNTPQYKNTLYLDKDGVLNVAILRAGKLSSPRIINEIEIKKDLQVIADFAKKKIFNLVIISNQPDLARKILTQNFLEKNIDMIRAY